MSRLFVESIVFFRVLLPWDSRRKYSEMFVRRRYWVLACKLVCSVFDNLLQKASLTLVQPKASVFLRPFHGFCDLAFKRNLLITWYLLFYRFHELTQLSSDVGNEKWHNHFSPVLKTRICRKCCRKFPYAAKIS